MSTGTLSEAIEVKGTAAEAWKVYATLELYDILLQKLPDILHKVEILQGHGGVGTVIKITFGPESSFTLEKANYIYTPVHNDEARNLISDMPGPSSLIEKTTIVDDEKRLKVTEQIEGGYLALGFTTFRVIFQVVENEMDENTCITKATVEYEIGEDASSFVSVKPYVTMMNAVADFLTKP